MLGRLRVNGRRPWTTVQFLILPHPRGINVLLPTVETINIANCSLYFTRASIMNNVVIHFLPKI